MPSCPHCQSSNTIYNREDNGSPEYRCIGCGKYFIGRRSRPLPNNRDCPFCHSSDTIYNREDNGRSEYKCIRCQKYFLRESKVSMNIKKTDLIKIIESVVRECISERNKRQLTESGLTSEKADGKVSPLDDIVRDVIKSGVKGRENIIKRAKELYKLQVSKQPVEDDSMHTALSDAGVTEASYKVVAPNSVATAKEDKARKIQTEPKVNEASYKVVAKKQATDAKEDKARKIQTEPKVNEASYKVVSKHGADTAKEDKARKIQTEPEVNETAYKVQGASSKTFKDSPQFPEAVNDPKNR